MTPPRIESDADTTLGGSLVLMLVVGVVILLDRRAKAALAARPRQVSGQNDLREQLGNPYY